MKNIILTILLSIITAIIAIQVMPKNESNDSATKNESAYERVIETGVLRCGYFSWTPSFIKNPQTGEMSGIFHDYMEEMAKALKIKIEWVEEIGLADYPAALKSGRLDAMCSSLYVTSERARVTDFITPIYYVPLHLYVRADDNRFNNKSVEELNNPAYTVSILEGGVTSILQRYYLPNTKVNELPQLTSPAELFTSVAMRKADFLMYDRYTFEDYNVHNPGKLRRLTTTPIKIFPLAIAVDKNQDALREMLDTATRDLYLAGVLDKIIAKYEIYEGSFYSPAPPYKAD